MTARPSSFVRCLFAALLAGLLIGAASNAAADSAVACPPAAQPPTPEQAQAAMKAARDRGFLWRIRKDGRTSYLYGTVHVAKMSWMYPGATVVEAVRSSDVVALELDLLDPTAIQQLQAGMAARPDHVLPDGLTERLRAQVSAACLPEQLVGMLAPEMVATTLVVMSARQQGLDPAYAIDTMFAVMGRSLRKPVSSLETPAMQLQLVLGRTPQETRVLVEQTLAELETGRAPLMVGRIAQVWSDGRLDELEHYEQWCDCVDTPEERALYKRLLDERNPALADRIDALHAAGKQVFAAVGSLHMIGRLGLPALMAQRGYKVDRVEFRP